jgi:3-hydroxybutyrate dehydrogenase
MSDSHAIERGCVALITGASSGIGRSTALALAAAGHSVALVGRDRERLAASAADVAKLGVRHASFVCDLADPAAIAALPARVASELGAVAILVNNAGIAESAPFLKTSRELWDRTLAIDLTAVFAVTQAFLPAMLDAKRGRVIQVASTAGKVGYRYVAAYVAAKHGVLGLTKALALEVAGKGVTVNAVCPSYVDTPLTEKSVANIVAQTGKSRDDARALLAKQNPQGRLVTPDEVAAMIAWLASDAARGVNGQALSICGGEVPY